MSYEITQDYISFGTARSGEKIEDVKFLVAHGTGNPGSTAYDNRDYFDIHQPPASAHTFIDATVILEIIPLDEKAWGVRYEVPVDDRLFGEDANDAAIHVELCWGGDIDFWESYHRYVWYFAHLCEQFGLNPEEHIAPHSRLDPNRRTDPQNALNRYGITWDDFIEDVKEAKSGNTVDRKEKVKGTTTTWLIQIGDTGEAVVNVQKKLKALGFYEGNIDGIFGPLTQSAVKEFQRSEGILVDGIVGPVTRKHLVNEMKNNNVDEYNLEAIVEYPGHYIQRGDVGEDVKRIQRAVNVKPDGIFGPITEEAVKAYQRRHGLKVDGIVGPITWGVMF